MKYLNSILSVVLVFAIIIGINADPEWAKTFAEYLKTVIVSENGYIFTWSSLLFLLILAVIPLTPLGKVRVGGLDKPEVGNFAYYSLVFCAGMGVSMIYWGVLEPHYHVADGRSNGEAVVITMFNWGLNAWAVYAVMAIAFVLGYTKHHEIDLRHLFENRWLNSIVTITIVVCTVLGIILSLVYAMSLITDGLSSLFGLEVSSVWIMLLMCIIASVSSFSGYLKGMKWLSQLNASFALLIMCFVWWASDSDILRGVWQYSLDYLWALVPMSLNTGSTQAEKEWLASWSYAYYAAWVNWAFFVSSFLVKISKGRTINQMIFASVVLPAAVSNIWFTVFGLSGIDAGATDVFELFGHYPLTELVSGITLLTVILYFITSADSAGYSMEQLTLPHTRVFWIMLIALTAIILLHFMPDSVGVGRTLVAVTAFPLLVCIYLVMGKAILNHYRLKRQPE